MSYTTTSNGEGALTDSGDALVDLFYKIGSARGQEEELGKDFAKALNADVELTSAILAWARDVRGGAGERDTFRHFTRQLIKKHPTQAKKLLKVIPEIGRYDDLRCAISTDLEDEAMDIWIEGIQSGNELANKWVNIKKDNRLRKRMNLSPKAFRKAIVAGRPNIVERKMAENKWDEITYPHVPSKCMAKNSKTFRKHDEDRFDSWVNDKTTKVNTGAIYPHEVWNLYRRGEKDVANKMWEQMTLELKGDMIPLIDVSASMDFEVSKGTNCMGIAIALGVYMAQRNTGVFQNKVVTFSGTSDIYNLPVTPDIGKVFDFTERMEWGGSTNLNAAYMNILKMAVGQNVPQEKMPKYMVIFSDMQFDQCATWKDDNHGGWGWGGCSKADHRTGFDKMKAEFARYGYDLPTIVFWNLSGAKYEGIPTASTEDGVCMVSGFTPFIMKAICDADPSKINPKNMMMDVLDKYVGILNK